MKQIKYLRCGIFIQHFLFYILYSIFSSAQVVLNEVMVRPSGNQGMISGGREYVEIYNNSCQQVDMGCYIIANRTAGGIYDNNGGFKFPIGTTIGPYQHLVVGTQYSSADSTNIDFNTNNYPGYVCNTGNWLMGNYDAWVALYDAGGLPLDAIYWTMNANEAAEITTGTDFDDNPCLPPGCTGAFTLLSAKQIFNSYPALITYVGQAPSTNLTYSRIADGGGWQREISPSISNASPTGNCNGGTCNPGSTFSLDTSSTNALCGANNGTVTATPNPAGTYTYLWSANTGNQTTQTATGLAAGTYFVTVTDASNCAVVDSVFVASSGGPTASAIVTPATCGNNNGTATANASGGTLPYSYSWNTNPQQTDSTATGLAPGNYSVTVTDNSGCIVVTTATVPASPAVTVNVTPETCSAGDGTATANPSGGTPSYSYLWNTTPQQTTQTATGLAAGNYSVTVTDGAGCTAVATTTVTGGPTLTVTANPSTCGNSDGNITANVLGGAMPYSYLWNTSGTTQTVTGLAAGNYSVTVTDGNNCTVTVDAAIGNIDGPTLTTMATPEICGNNNGTAAADVSGGTSPYSYSWNTAPPQSDSTATGLSTGNYSVTVTDDNNCTDTASVTIIELPAFIDTISAAICSGDTIFLQGNYQSTAGTYYDSLTSVLGCDSVIITTLTVNQSAVSSQQSAICSGDSIFIGGSYQTASGIYSDSLTSVLGCDSIVTTDLTVYPKPVVFTGVDTTINKGASVQLNAGGGVSYSWSPVSGLSCSTCPNPVATPAQSITYYVTIVDGNDCAAIDSVVLKILSVECFIDDNIVPNAFSPNGDGENEILLIKGKNIELKTFRIYNRWGEEIFKTEDKNTGWNGFFRRKPVNSGVYVYYLHVGCPGEEPKTIKGNVTLVR